MGPDGFRERNPFIVCKERVRLALRGYLLRCLATLQWDDTLDPPRGEYRWAVPGFQGDFSINRMGLDQEGLALLILDCTATGSWEDSIPSKVQEKDEPGIRLVCPLIFGSAYRST